MHVARIFSGARRPAVIPPAPSSKWRGPKSCPPRGIHSLLFAKTPAGPCNRAACEEAAGADKRGFCWWVHCCATVEGAGWKTSLLPDVPRARALICHFLFFFDSTASGILRGTDLTLVFLGHRVLDFLCFLCLMPMVGLKKHLFDVTPPLRESTVESRLIKKD